MRGNRETDTNYKHKPALLLQRIFKISVAGDISMSANFFRLSKRILFNTYFIMQTPLERLLCLILVVSLLKSKTCSVLQSVGRAGILTKVISLKIFLVLLISVQCHVMIFEYVYSYIDKCCLVNVYLCRISNIEVLEIS